jgi:hypothetical protein
MPLATGFICRCEVARQSLRGGPLFREAGFDDE